MNDFDMLGSVYRSATTLRTITVSAHQQHPRPPPAQLQPPRNDEPPKYANLTGVGATTPWYQAPAMRHPPASVRLIDSSAQQPTASASVSVVSSSLSALSLLDSPPPYSEVAPQFGAPSQQLQQQQQRY